MSLKLGRMKDRQVKTMNKNSEHYPLTHPQKGIWLTESFYKGTGVCNIVMSIKLGRELEFGFLQNAVNKVIEQNDGIRLRMTEINGEVRQLVSPYREYQMEIVDFSGNQDGEGVRAWLENHTKSAFCLLDSDLFYFAVLKLPDGENVLYLKLHHLITDGWGMSLFVNQVIEYYGLLKAGGQLPDSTKPSYVQYISSEAEYHKSRRFEQDREFWNKEFEAALPEVSTSRDNGDYRNIRASRKTYVIAPELTASIQAFCKANNISAYVFFLTALYVYRSRISSLKDIVIGTVFYNRTNASDKNTAGMFVNTIPFRLNTPGSSTWIDALKTASLKLSAILRHQKYSYDLLLNDLRQKYKMEGTLFDVILSYQNSVFNASQEWHFSGYETNTLAMHVSDRESSGQILLEIDYQTAVYCEEEILHFINHLMNLIENGIKEPDKPVSEIEMLSEKEKAQLLYGFNEGSSQHIEDKTIHQLFEACACKTKNLPALVYQDRTLTYGELNEKANRLARTLRGLGVKPDSLVGLVADRSFEMITGILGILKAGGAYVPISPDYPKERIGFILKDSGIRLILAQSRYVNFIGESGNTDTLNIINLEDEKSYSEDSTNVETINSAGNLAYVIYTSGSTGVPKGVMVEHRSVVNILLALQQEYPLTESDSFLFKTTYTFDVSVAELFGWFFDGGRLVILKKDAEKDPESIAEAVYKNGVTHINFVPSMLNGFLNALDGRDISNLGSLKYVFAAGEALPPTTVEKFHSLLKECRLENLYGPTESTVYATGFEAKNSRDKINVPIGKPLRNIKAYIMNREHGLLPAGIAGELCLGGAGLARGYLNREELTKEKFINNPYAEGEKIYLTGDLARWNQDGNLEFMGRIDHQVKIRGYRIELGEIESALLSHQLVSEAAVIAREEQGSPYLCAYIVPAGNANSEELREFLKQKLPEYMLPSFYIFIEKIPVLWSGKVDRKALPAPLDLLETRTGYKEPESRMEQVLAEAWTEALGVGRVGVEDNFFSLGGDSIKAIQIVSYLNKHSLKIDITDLFKNPTIRKLASKVRGKTREAYQGTVTGEIKLSPIQKWFFESNFTDMHYWNQAFMLFCRDGFDEERIRQVFTGLVMHHDALRMVFWQEAGQFIQFNRGDEGELFSLEVRNLEGGTGDTWRIEQFAKKIQGSIDLERGPLVKLGLFKTPSGDHLLIAIHHLVVDGVSWRILLEDFAKGYKQLGEGRTVEFDRKTDSYCEWVENLQRYAHSPSLQNQCGYWEEQKGMTGLPAGFGSFPDRQKDSNTVTVCLSREITGKLLKETHRAYNTEINDILLTALGLTVSDWTGSSKVFIDVEGHGREQITDEFDVSRTIGWFTSIFPVKLDMAYRGDLPCQIKAVKEYMRNIPDKGVGYGVLRYLTSFGKNQFGLSSQKPEIRFNYLGDFDAFLEQSFYTLSDIPAGPLVSPNSERQYALDINMLVIHGSLNVAINYNKFRYDEKLVNKLAESFTVQLIKIINHCAEKSMPEITPGDLTSKSLGQKDMDDIFAELEEKNF
ncbi:MAG TPA: amino acid adenylation domain-containing protein [Ruminiclostridium sp.]|nr:amino acid adenylation domain-containing protein [Ruminiclostridium sp.]